jgi:hypothetical protein
MPKSLFDYDAPQKPEEDEDEESSLLDKVFKLVSRPGAATAGAVAGALSDKPGTEGDALKRGWENLRGARTDTFDTVLEEQGYEDTKKRNIAGFVGDLVIDPLNVLPVGAIAKGAKALGKATGATKLVEKAKQTGVAKELGEKFIPHFGLSKFKQATGDLSYADTRRLANSKLGYAKEQAAKKSLDLFSDVTPDEAREIATALDEGRVLADPRLEKMRSVAKTDFDAQWAREAAQGVMDPQKKVANYVTYLLNRKHLAGDRVRALSGKNRFSLTRRLQSLKQAVAAGAEPDVRKIYAARMGSGEKAVIIDQFFKDTAKQFGTKVARGKPTPAGFRQVKLAAEAPVKTKLKGIYFPDEIAKDMERMVEIPKQLGPLGEAFHGMTALWKGYATRLNPAFHFRNAMSNVVNSWLGGIAAHEMVPRHAQAFNWARTGMAPAIGKHSSDEIALAAKQFGVTGGHHTSFNELDDLVSRQLENATGAKKVFTSKYSPLAPNNRALEVGANVGNLIEETSRRAIFIDQLSKGKSLEQAALHVRKYLFDYSELTDFERKIRDYGVPFYTWIRKNLPLQLESVINQPRKFAAMAKGETALEQATEGEGIRVPKENRPEYLNELGAVQLPTETDTGAKVFWNPALPAQDINALPVPTAKGMKDFFQKDVIARLNPALKVPIEVGMGKEAFSGRGLYNISPSELRPANPLATALGQGANAAGVPELAAALGIQTTNKGIEMPAMLDYAMRQLPMTQTLGRVLAEPSPQQAAGHLSEQFLGASPGQLNVLGFTNKTLNPRQLREVAKRRNRDRKANATRERREKARVTKTQVDSLYERYLAGD